MGYQFAHIETYARKSVEAGEKTKGGKTRKTRAKASVADVLKEANREAGHHPHVQHPQHPALVFGLDIPALEALHDSMASQAKSTMKNGKSRAVRTTQATLLAGVLSHPGSVEGWSQEAVQDWQKKSIEWLKGRYGEQLKTVVRHDDESHPHLHFYVVPSGSEMKANNLHDGAKAKADYLATSEAKTLDPKTANKNGDRAYRDAMRAFQDDYFAKVCAGCGLERLGPKRQRKQGFEHQRDKQTNMLQAESNLLKEQKARECERVASEAKKKAERATEQEQKVKKSLRGASRKLRATQEELSELVENGFFLRLFSGLNLWVAGAKREMKETIEKNNKENESRISRLKRQASAEISKLKSKLSDEMEKVTSYQNRTFRAENNARVEREKHEKTREELLKSNEELSKKQNMDNSYNKVSSLKV